MTFESAPALAQRRRHIARNLPPLSLALNLVWLISCGLTAPLAFFFSVGAVLMDRRSKLAWTALAVSLLGLVVFFNSVLVYSSLDLPAPLNRWQFAATAPMSDGAWADYPDTEILAARGNRSPFGYTGGTIHLRSTRAQGFAPAAIEQFAGKLGWTLVEAIPVTTADYQALLNAQGEVVSPGQTVSVQASEAAFEAWGRQVSIARLLLNVSGFPLPIRRDSTLLQFQADVRSEQDTRITFVILTDDRREIMVHTSFIWP